MVSVEQLAERIGAPELRIVDVRWYLLQPGRGRAEYDAGHIPGAIHLDLDTDLSAPSGPGRHPLPAPGDFRRRLAESGIGSAHHVVAYDDSGGTSAARLWWMLDNLGHEQVAVLDGGITAWVAAGLPLVTDIAGWPPAELELAAQWTNVIVRDELAERLGHVVLLDARAADRYRGEVEPIDPAAGHIPTAISAPTAGNLARDGQLLPPDELERRYAGLGAAGSTTVVTSCGSGTTACHNALAMRLAGLPDPLLYAGSFSDWSTAGMPVATGAEPGRPMVLRS